MKPYIVTFTIERTVTDTVEVSVMAEDEEFAMDEALNDLASGYGQVVKTETAEHVGDHIQVRSDDCPVARAEFMNA